MSPRTCDACGRRGKVQNPRAIAHHIWRRYHCRCGNRWSTIEVRRLSTASAPILDVLRVLVTMDEYEKGSRARVTTHKVR